MNYIERRRNAVKQHNEDRPRIISFEELKEITKKRFQVVFVGAISKIEDSFGYLWGDDEIDESDMTPAQKEVYLKFLELREQIFDQGNEQYNKYMKDLINYNISENVISRVEFKTKDKK